IVTVAPGRTAPLSSCTVPETVAVLTCAEASCAEKANTNSVKQKFRNTIKPPPKLAVNVYFVCFAAFCGFCLLTNSYDGPVKRNQQHQDYGFNDRQTEPNAKQVPGFKITVRVPNHHYSRLIYENFAARCERPDHPE